VGGACSTIGKEWQRISIEESETHYEHAPIVEAIVEIQFKAPKSIALSDLLQFHATVSSEYRRKQEQHAFEISVGGPSSAPSTAGGLAGYDSSVGIRSKSLRCESIHSPSPEQRL